MDIISIITSSSAAIVGSLYAIGFFIITFNLSQYGIEEFQLLNTKYLYVGLNFIVVSLALFTMGAFISLFIFMITEASLISPYLVINSLAGITLIGSLAMYKVVGEQKAKKNKESKKNTGKHKHFYFFIGISIASNLMPSYAIGQKYINNLIDIDFIIVTALSALFFIAQIGYYSRFNYGRPNPFSKIDRTGYGLYQNVQLILNEKHADSLSRVQVPIIESGITGILRLIEITSNDYYIIIPSDKSKNTYDDKVIKISKNDVFAVIYHQDKSE